MRRGVTARGLGAIPDDPPAGVEVHGTQAPADPVVKTWTDRLSTTILAHFAGKKKQMFGGRRFEPVGKSIAQSA
jgi:hypothetical protein